MALNFGAPKTLSRVLGYGAFLAAGTALLQLLDYQSLVRDNVRDLYIALVAAAFLAGGVAIGMRLMVRPQPVPPGNPRARAALGISDREVEVLRLLAGGQSNKEIARVLGISPNTVKTHVARLYEKLEARRRTDAVAKAQALGLL
jgi:DNA-binding CsgD family transcriptional regulator